MTYDYIIIGAGSAGCVIAKRLSKNLGAKTLLLEKGKRDINPLIHFVGGYPFLMQNKSIIKNYITESVKNLNGRKIEWPRGEVLGGCSSINGMLHIRAQTSDFDLWENNGNVGWGWKDVLPFYKKIEQHEINDNELHGADGPIKISLIKNKHKINEAFLQGCKELNYPINEDLNGSSRMGSGYMQLACFRGRRYSSAKGYLSNLGELKNLNISTNSNVIKILFKNKRATGVTYLKNGVKHEVKANKEIIISAGSINTPKLLQLSGVGPKDLLETYGIEVVNDLQGVGENLQDHLQINSVYKTKNSYTFNDINNSFIRKLFAGIKYFFFRKGIISEGATQVGLFNIINTNNINLEMQYFVTLASGDVLKRRLDKFSGITIAFYQGKPKSKGTIKITSSSYKTDPLIYPNYLSHEHDKIAVIEGLKLTRIITNTKSMSHLIEKEHMPGNSVATDMELLEYAQNVGKTNYHPLGTCKMGNDAMSVVDNKLRVRGISCLRIADASVIPNIISSNINATVLMIGERASEFIIDSEKERVQK